MFVCTTHSVNTSTFASVMSVSSEWNKKRKSQRKISHPSNIVLTLVLLLLQVQLQIPLGLALFLALFFYWRKSENICASSTRDELINFPSFWTLTQLHYFKLIIINEIWETRVEPEFCVNKFYWIEINFSLEGSTLKSLIKLKPLSMNLLIRMYSH